MKLQFKSFTLVSACLVVLLPFLSAPSFAGKDKQTNQDFEEGLVFGWESVSPSLEDIQNSPIPAPIKLMVMEERKIHKYYITYSAQNTWASLSDASLRYVPLKSQWRGVETVSVVKFNCMSHTYAVKPASERFFATSKYHTAIGGSERLSVSELFNYDSPTRDEKAVSAWFNSLDHLPLKRFNFSVSKYPKDNFEVLALQQLQNKLCAIETKHTVENKDKFATKRKGNQTVISRLYKDSVKIETGDPEMWGYVRQPVYNPTTHNLDFLAQTFTVRTPSGLVSMDSEDRVRINCRALTSATVSLYALYPGIREKYENTLDKASEKLDKVKAEIIVESENPVLYRTMQGLCAQYQSKSTLAFKPLSALPTLPQDATLNNQMVDAK